MTSRTTVLLGLALLFAAQAVAQERLEWDPQGPAFTVAVPEASFLTSLRVADMDSVEVFNVPLVLDGVRLSAALYAGGDTLRITPERPGSHTVRLVGASREAAVVFNFQQLPEARFTPDYRRTRGGTSRVEVPEVYELVNVAFALTPTGRDSSNVLVWRHGGYYDRVMGHFARFADHPVVAELERVIQDDAYVGVRANAYAFAFDGDRIVPDSAYLALAFDKHRIDALVPALEDFARQTGFRSFFAASAPEYEHQRAELAALVPVRQMWDWLESEFSARSQSYVTVFSPLTYGTHNAATLQDGDYRETLVFLAGPGILDDPDRSIVGRGTPAWREVDMSRIAFTEYDHPYVNPAMGPYEGEIARAMADLDIWNRVAAYRTPSETFAEYMTWAVFLVYVDAHYPADTAAEAREGVVRFMEVNRGFVRFGAFSDILTAQYASRQEGETLESLLPSMVDWVSQQ